MMRQRWLRIGWVGLVVVLALFVVACAGGDATVEEPTGRDSLGWAGTAGGSLCGLPWAGSHDGGEQVGC